jgi:hypothetical protein
MMIAMSQCDAKSMPTRDRRDGEATVNFVRH